MANSAQARKRIRQHAKNRLHNMSRRSRLSTCRKKFLKAIESQELDLAKTLFMELQKLCDRFAAKHLIHKNTAARIKSRSNSKLKALATAESA